MTLEDNDKSIELCEKHKHKHIGKIFTAKSFWYYHSMSLMGCTKLFNKKLLIVNIHPITIEIENNINKSNEVFRTHYNFSPFSNNHYLLLECLLLERTEKIFVITHVNEDDINLQTLGF